MKLSVLMVCPQFRPIVGGAERQAEKLSRALARRGVRVKILTPKLVADTPEYEEDAGVVIHRFPLFDLCKRLPGIRGLGPLNLLLMRNQVIRVMNRHLGGVDVVHTHIASPLTAFAMSAAKPKGIPVLCKVASAGPLDDLHCLNRIVIGGNWLRNLMIRNLDCWIATTQAVRRCLLDWGVVPDRIVVTPNGVDLDGGFMPKRRVSAVRRFVYLGRLSTTAQRDLPALVRAFVRLTDQLPNAELALVGDGNLFQETADLVEKCGKGERIRMPGLQEPEPWLNWADCFVLPSRYEGLSNALLEAMAYGLPCIANDIPSNREVLDNGRAGVLVPVGDEDRLYLEMMRIARDPDYAHTLGCAALERARKCYSIEAVADRYIELYESLTK